MKFRKRFSERENFAQNTAQNIITQVQCSNTSLKQYFKTYRDPSNVFSKVSMYSPTAQNSLNFEENICESSSLNDSLSSQLA